MNTTQHTRQVSAANTQNQIIFDLGDARDTLSIASVGSGGTHTLTIESSIEGTNWVTVDVLVAALNQAKAYSAATVGATTAISPLSYRYVRITSSAAGIGFTTTLTASAK